MTEKMQCSKCEVRACTVDAEGKRISGDPPSWCPMITKADVIKGAMEKYTDEDRKIAHAAAVVESEAYVREPWGLKPYATRVLEIINFAKKMEYKKIGIACCFASGWDANVLHNALANRGFEVLARFCKIDQVKNTTFLVMNR